MYSTMNDEQKRRDDFKMYLESKGIMNSVIKSLAALYHEEPKPTNPITFIQKQMGDIYNNKDEVSTIENIISKYQELIRRLSRYENVEDLKIDSTSKNNLDSMMDTEHQRNTISDIFIIRRQSTLLNLDQAETSNSEFDHKKDDELKKYTHTFSTKPENNINKRSVNADQNISEKTSGNNETELKSKENWEKYDPNGNLMYKPIERIHVLEAENNVENVQFNDNIENENNEENNIRIDKPESYKSKNLEGDSSDVDENARLYQTFKMTEMRIDPKDIENPMNNKIKEPKKIKNLTDEITVENTEYLQPKIPTPNRISEAVSQRFRNRNLQQQNIEQSESHHFDPSHYNHYYNNPDNVKSSDSYYFGSRGMNLNDGYYNHSNLQNHNNEHTIVYPDQNGVVYDVYSNYEKMLFENIMGPPLPRNFNNDNNYGYYHHNNNNYEH